jgi:antitoxin component YwqK of YwqJK toxin-antitoxin module
MLSCNDSSNSIVENTDSRLRLANGVLLYNELPFSGKVISNYTSMQLKSEIQYVKGRKNGLEKKWSQNGNVIEKRSYTNGFKSGIHKACWPDGTPKFEYYFNERGEFHGTVKEWTQSGLLYMSFNYANGKEEGRQRLWKLDGSIKANYEVVDGERFGLIGLKKCYTITVNEDEIE